MTAASVDPESISWIRVIIAFAIVFGLLAGLGYIMRYLGSRGYRMPGLGANKQRLRLMETLPLDARRRLVIVRCDGREHLLLLGLNQDIVVEAGLQENQAASPLVDPTLT